MEELKEKVQNIVDQHWDNIRLTEIQQRDENTFLIRSDESYCNIAKAFHRPNDIYFIVKTLDGNLIKVKQACFSSGCIMKHYLVPTSQA